MANTLDSGTGIQGYYRTSCPLPAYAFDDSWHAAENMALESFLERAAPILDGLVKQFQDTDARLGAAGYISKSLREHFVKRCMTEMGNVTEGSLMRHNGIGNTTAKE
jgi:hypothetical protein